MNAYGLPIEEVLPVLREALARSTRGVLSAPPGAGKTTCVPLALLNESWLAGNRIVMLEPRRLAARAAAARMAALLNEQPGECVGYRIRMETCTGPATRVEVVTEGILTRMLQSDPALPGVGAIIFDEFHERSLHADLGLALCLDAARALRPDLRVLVMSATLDTDAVARLLGNAQVITSPGRTHPVETHYRDRPVPGRVETAVAHAVRAAIDAHTGGVLVFLPGEREIRSVADLLTAANLPAGVAVMPLLGALDRTAQDQAVSPASPGVRKVVLATSIAETSLTISDISVVVDSGLMRVPRFDARTAMTMLATVPVTRAAADQRRGRAGRTGPGVCYRLWTCGRHESLMEHTPPEIRSADLTGLALELALWGEPHPERLSWLDPPPPGTLDRARDLLHRLGALDAGGCITAHGRHLATAGIHPRLAHMIITSQQWHAGYTACLLAALLSERDILHASGTAPGVDIAARLELLSSATAKGPGISVVRTQAAQLQQRLQVSGTAADRDTVARLVVCAYPDRIALRRDAGWYQLANGQRASIDPADPLSVEPVLAVARIGGLKGTPGISLAAPCSIDLIENQVPALITAETQIVWDPEARAVRARCQRRFGSLVLREQIDAPPDVATAAEVFLHAIDAHWPALLPWTPALRSWQQRVLLLRRMCPGQPWPDVSDDHLRRSLRDWLLPHIAGITRADRFTPSVLSAALRALLPWHLSRDLDELAPTHVQVPTGSRIALDYSANPPVLAVRIQELFGLGVTPSILAGRLPLTLHLLSPAMRPVQVTDDLAGFWARTYFDVRRELKGRYPRHDWPDDPRSARPTRSTRRKRTGRTPHGSKK